MSKRKPSEISSEEEDDESFKRRDNKNTPTPSPHDPFQVLA